MIDKRKKEHPRTTKLTLNTDKETAQKLRAEAGRKGLSISEHLNNKLKAWKRFQSSSPISNISSWWRTPTNSTPHRATWHGWRLHWVTLWNRTAGEDSRLCRDATRERLQHHEDRRLSSSLTPAPLVGFIAFLGGFFMQGVRVLQNNPIWLCIAVISMSICFVFSFSIWFTVADPRSPSPFTLKLKQPTGQNSRDGHGKSRVFCWGYPPIKTPARTKKVLRNSQYFRLHSKVLCHTSLKPFKNESKRGHVRKGIAIQHNPTP